MALGSTQPLTEMSTRKLPWGKGRPARKADNLTAICEPIAPLWNRTPAVQPVAVPTTSGYNCVCIPEFYVPFRASRIVIISSIFYII
jgi:hypothetical protein